MTKVNVSTLKNELSRFLRLVKDGDDVLILDRGQPVARLVRVDRVPGKTSEEEHLQQLEEKGMVRRGRGNLAPDFFKHRAKCRGSVVDALIEERA